MTEQQLKELGFILIDTFKHDEYHTNRYFNGGLEVEFTYIGNKLLTCDLTILDLNCHPITLEEIKILTEILVNKVN